jgi:hypothetical protein
MHTLLVVGPQDVQGMITHRSGWHQAKRSELNSDFRVCIPPIVLASLQRDSSPQIALECLASLHGQQRLQQFRVGSLEFVSALEIVSEKIQAMENAGGAFTIDTIELTELECIAFWLVFKGRYAGVEPETLVIVTGISAAARDIITVLDADPAALTRAHEPYPDQL